MKVGNFTKVAIDNEFWPDLGDHLETIALFAGFAGLILASYQLFIPTSLIARNHVRLIAVVHWASEGSWLSMMQSGIRSVLGLLQLLYGPPKEGAGALIAQNLTVRAWKMSAWIAAFLLFFVPPMFFAFLIPIIEYREGRSIPWEALYVGLGIAMLVAVPFGVTWRTIRREDEFRDHSGIEAFEDAVVAVIHEGTLLTLVMMPLTLASFAVGLLGFSQSKMFGAVLTGAVVIAGMTFLAGLVRAIRRHGFLAPVAYLGIILVILLYCVSIMSLMVTFEEIVSGRSLTTLWFIPAWGLTVLCLIEAIPGRLTRSRISQRFLLLFCFTLSYFFFSGDATSNLFAERFIEFIVLVVFALLGPYIIAVYAAIYSNAIPDWFSIALNRSLLTRASETTRLRTFAIFLFYDAACAIFLCILTATILIIAFTFSGLMIETSTNFLDFFSTNSLRDSASFFFGGLKAPFLLIELISGIPGRELSFSNGPDRAGAVMVILLAALSLTSLLPTLLNAVTISALIGARVVALIVGTPMRTLHTLLVVNEGLPAEDRTRALTRGAVIIAAFTAAIYCLIYAVIWMITQNV